jgi:hypothetical protein
VSTATVWFSSFHLSIFAFYHAFIFQTIKIHIITSLANHFTFANIPYSAKSSLGIALLASPYELRI